MTASNDTIETAVDPLDNPQVNKAAHNFQESIKVIKSRTGALSKKSMERVFDAVMEFPLSTVQPNFRNAMEHELFVLSLNCLAAKNVMMQAIIAEQTRKEALLKDAADAVNNMEEGVINEPNT